MHDKHTGRRKPTAAHRHRKALRIRAAYMGYLLPQANKYRNAGIGCLKSARVSIREYIDIKKRLQRIESEGEKPADMALLARIRRGGGVQEYLSTMLAYARGNLQAAHSFGAKATGCVLP